MNLLEALTKSGVTIVATPGMVDIPATQPHKPPHKAFRLTVSIQFPDEKDPVTRVWRNGQPYGEPQPLETLVARMVREHRPDHLVFQAWLKSEGAIPVRLSKGVAALGADPWAEAIHTGLRKLSGGVPASMAWYSLNEARSPVCSTVWAVVREAVEFELSQLDATRRSCAIAVKSALVAALNGSAPPQRLPSILAYREHPKYAELRQEYATKMLALAVESSPLEDFMYAWLGYVLDDIPSED